MTACLPKQAVTPSAITLLSRVFLTQHRGVLQQSPGCLHTIHPVWPCP